MIGLGMVLVTAVVLAGPSHRLQFKGWSLEVPEDWNEEVFEDRFFLDSPDDQLHMMGRRFASAGEFSREAATVLADIEHDQGPLTVRRWSGPGRLRFVVRGTAEVGLAHILVEGRPELHLGIIYGARSRAGMTRLEQVLRSVRCRL